MWCDSYSKICLNPLCLAGCVDLKHSREFALKAAELQIAMIKAAAGPKEDEGSK